jgi:hypothetical protein
MARRADRTPGGAEAAWAPIQRAGETATREPHKLEKPGSTPGLATTSASTRASLVDRLPTNAAPNPFATTEGGGTQSERDGLFDRACYQTPGHRSRMSPAPIYPLVGICRAAGLPEPVPEYRWHPVRKFRADYAFPLHRVLIEIDGGLFINGGHSRGAARMHDMAKDRAATLLGWRTLRYAPTELTAIISDLRILLAGDAT